MLLLADKLLLVRRFSSQKLVRTVGSRYLKLIHTIIPPVPGTPVQDIYQRCNSSFEVVGSVCGWRTIRYKGKYIP